MVRRRRNPVVSTATLPFRLVGKTIAGVTYPIRHPIKTVKAPFRGAYVTGRAVGRPLAKAGLYAGRQALRPVRATGRGIRATVRGATYPARHPIRSARAFSEGTARTVNFVETVWDSRQGKWIRKISPYAAAAIASATFAPGAPLLAAGIGASATRAALKPESLSRKVYAAAGKAVAFPFREGYAGGKRIASDVWGLSVKEVEALIEKAKEEKEEKNGLTFSEYIDAFPFEERINAARLWVEYKGKVPGAETPEEAVKNAGESNQQASQSEAKTQGPSRFKRVQASLGGFFSAARNRIRPRPVEGISDITELRRQFMARTITLAQFKATANVLARQGLTNPKNFLRILTEEAGKGRLKTKDFERLTKDLSGVTQEEVAQAREHIRQARERQLNT